VSEEENDKLVTRINTPSTGKLTRVYDVTATSGKIVSEITADSSLTDSEVEILTETIDRGRGLINSGFKFSLGIPKWLGGGKIEIEKKPMKETKTTVRKKYKRK
jgi:hypothetical protein